MVSYDDVERITDVHLVAEKKSVCSKTWQNRPAKVCQIVEDDRILSSYWLIHSARARICLS